MNTEILSVKEIISYVDNGTLIQVDAEAVMRIVEYYEDEISNMKEDIEKAKDSIQRAVNELYDYEV